MGVVLRRLVLVSAAAALVSGCAGTPRKVALPLHELRSLSVLQAQAAKLASSNPRAPAVVGLWKSLWEHRVEGERWTLRSAELRRYVVLDGKNRYVARFSKRVSRRWKIESITLVVLTAGGEVHRFGTKDLHVAKARDGRIYKLVYPGISKGAVVEERVVMVRARAPLTQVAYLARGLPVMRREHDVYYPERWRVQVRKLARPLHLVTRTADGGRKVLSYRGRNLPGLVREPFAPPDLDEGQFLALRIREAWIGARKVFVDLGWRRLSRHARKIGAGGPDVAVRVRDLAQKVSQGATTRAAKLRAILRYVQENVQRAPRWSKRGLAAVLSGRRGSPMEIATLTTAMLRAVGISAELALVHSRKDGHFDKAFASSIQLGEVCVVAAMGNSPLVLLPHHRHLAPGGLPWWIVGQPALMLRSTGRDIWFRLPERSPITHRVSVTMKVAVDDAGKVAVEEERRLFGLAGLAARSRLADKSERGRRRALWGGLARSGATKLTRPTVEGLERPERPLVLRYRYRHDSTLRVYAGGAALRCRSFLFPSRRKPLLLDPAHRVRGVYVPSESVSRRRLEVLLPANWQLAAMPEPQKVNNVFGSATLTFRQQGRRLVVERVVRINKGSQPPHGVVALAALLDSKVPETLVFRRLAK